MSSVPELGTKCCKSCKRTLPLSEFHESNPGKPKPNCKTCCLARTNARYKNRGKKRAILVALNKEEVVKEGKLPLPQREILDSVHGELVLMARRLHWKLFVGVSVYTSHDLLNDTLLKMYVATSWPPPEKEQLLRWAYVIMQNVGTNYFREKRKMEAKLAEYLVEEKQEAIPDLLSVLEDTLASAIAKLKPAHAQSLPQSYYPLSEAQAAQEQGDNYDGAAQPLLSSS